VLRRLQLDAEFVADGARDSGCALTVEWAASNPSIRPRGNPTPHSPLPTTAATACSAERQPDSHLLRPSVSATPEWLGAFIAGCALVQVLNQAAV
jgi:hypothetical protein